MAKAWPKVGNRRPGHPGNRPPNAGRPRPFERDQTYRQIGQLIVNAWKDAVGKDGQAPKPIDREQLQARISEQLELIDDPKGKVEIGIILDPKPEPGRKFIWIVIPYPDAPEGSTEAQWVDVYDNSNDLKTRLGEAVLFGCGR
jgi:hypothetical protein